MIQIRVDNQYYAGLLSQRCFVAYLGDGDISPKGAGLIDIIPGNIKLPNPNKMKVQITIEKSNIEFKILGRKVSP